MTKIIIEWKHFDKNGATCERCLQTGNNLQEVIKDLQKGFDVEFKETKLPEDRMSESNQIIINGKLLEDLIPDTKVGENFCSSCTDLTDNSSDCHCRTINQGDTTYEEIPTDLIKTAIFDIINSKSKLNMKIQVIGSGCPTCKTLYELTKTAVKELGVDAEVEYSTDITKIIELGVMESPIMTINGKIALLGSGSLEKIKEVIAKGKDTAPIEKKSECSCEGNCC